MAVSSTPMWAATGGGSGGGLGTQSPGDGALHEVPGFIPAQPQQPGRPLDVALHEHVNREALEERGETSHWLRPRQSDLVHTVLGALDPRWPRVKVGEEL